MTDVTTIRIYPAKNVFRIRCFDAVGKAVFCEVRVSFGNILVSVSFIQN